MNANGMTSKDLTPEMLEWLTRSPGSGPPGDPEDLERLHIICWGKDACPCSRCAQFRKARRAIVRQVKIITTQKK